MSSKKKSPKKPRFKWVFEIEVDETWVADGFNPDAFQMQEAVRSQMLGYAYDHEVKVKLVKDADQRAVAKAQGYSSATHMKSQNGVREKRV